jgi:hypothetical protein
LFWKYASTEFLTDLKNKWSLLLKVILGIAELLFKNEQSCLLKVALFSPEDCYIYLRESYIIHTLLFLNDGHHLNRWQALNVIFLNPKKGQDKNPAPC